MTTKIASVIGVGARRGLGASLCMRAAKAGYHVVVGGRTLEKLQKIVDEIVSTGGAATAITVDVTQPDSVSDFFQRSSEIDGQLDFVTYNVGNAFIQDSLSMSPDYFEEAWRTCCFGGFLCVQQAATQMLRHGKGTILFTGATASLRAKDPFIAFASGKAALRAVAQGFARELGPKNIHVGHVIIDGAIDGEKIGTRMPELKERLGPGGMLQPDDIAEAYWQLHEQPPYAWTFELDLRPSIENF